MKKETKTVMLILTFAFLALSSYSQVDSLTKFKMFCSALNNISTTPNYVVVIVKNIKTGEIKEICTEATLLCGAVNKRSGKTNLIINCKKYETRYFEFSKKKALNNISFDLYTKEDLNSFAETINIKDIVDQVKSNKLTSKTFTGSRKEQIMFAHLMFNNGVMMTSGCYAGNICSLIYFIAK